MKKTPLTDNSGRWFDLDSANAFEADSYTDSQSGQDVCRATNSPHVWETLYITRKGNFVLVRESENRNWPEAEGALEIDNSGAVQWLIVNGHQEELKKMELASEEDKLEL